MAQSDALKRYVDAGMAFTQMTRSRAEAIVRDLVRAGEIQREQTQEWVEELVERSRKNTEQLLDLVRREVAQQLTALGVAARSRARAGRRVGATKGPAKRPAASKATTTKKAGPRKAVAKKAATKRSGQSGAAKKA